MAGLTIFFLASIESLLSASVVDSMSKQTRVDEVEPSWERLRDEMVEANQELAAGHRQTSLAVVDATTAPLDGAEDLGSLR